MLRSTFPISLLVLAAGALPVSGAAPAHPNIVFILADDLGYGDLGCYGAPDIRTPHIDALAQSGVRLTNFYANSAVCTPSRAGLMTGRYQQRIGGLEWALYPRTQNGLPAQERTVATQLKEAGYATAISGKWHLGTRDEQAPNRHGFDEFFGMRGGEANYFTHQDEDGVPDLYLNEKPVVMKGYTTDLVTDYALKFIDQLKSHRFFLYVAYTAPHFPLQGPADENIQLSRKTWYSGSRATYCQMVEREDEGVGRIVAALRQAGLASNTLVVFTSDNGGDIHRGARNLPLRGGKHTFYEGGLRVPCIAVLPGYLPAGAVCDQACIMMDWTAGMLALAGGCPPADRRPDGIDVLPVLAGEEPPFDRTLLFWRKRDQRGILGERAVRSGRWKYIWWPDGLQELYDLSTDVAEQRNLAATQPALARELHLNLDSWERDLVPPLYDQNPDQLPNLPAASGNEKSKNAGGHLGISPKTP